VSLERRVKKLEESNPTDEASMAARAGGRRGVQNGNAIVLWPGSALALKRGDGS
jgi:hypothetical protein